MSKNVIVFLIFSIINIYVYAQEKKTYWDNGNLKSITNHKDGKKTGIWNYYFENGERKELKRYDNGKAEGRWYEYYYNGETKRVRAFYNGTLTEYTSYHLIGRIMVKGTFDENEKKHGNWQQLYENGQIKLNGDYNHGKKHDKWKFYNAYGNINKIENYNNGVKTSKWEVINVDKNKIDKGANKVINYYNNKLNGEWKFYNENDKCIEIGNFINDDKDGEWTYLYDNDQIKKIELWDNGKLMEIISNFDENGRALNKGTLKKGNGTVIEYNSEGEISVVEYGNGKKVDWDNSSILNSMAWHVYEVESDKEKIVNAIVWVKRSIELDKNYYNTDTYAALLYKIGSYNEALFFAQEAIELAKNDGDDFGATIELIEKINIGLKKTEIKN